MGLDSEAWRGCAALFAHHALSPWLAMVDGGRYCRHVEQVRALDATPGGCSVRLVPFRRDEIEHQVRECRSKTMHVGADSCALRIVPPGVSFEQGWDVDLSELAGGRPAGEFVLANDRVGFFRAFYDDEVGVTAENWTDKQGTPGYRWWRWEIGADHAEEIADQQLSVEAAHYVVGGKTYVGNPSADWSSTTIVELDPEGRLLEGLTVQGTPGGILQAL